MKESLLQFIWQQQYFNSRDLRLTTGEEVQVLSPGRLNTDQGPDFLDARLRIGEICWAGAVELHVMASDWQRHAHGTDRHYQQVILHVVWTNDVTIRDLPTLTLEGRVAGWLLGRYEQWMRAGDFIACQRQIAGVAHNCWPAWKQTLLEQRLHRRVRAIDTYLAGNCQHWEETCWWLMARTLGGPVNGPAFEMIARSLPLTLLARQKGMDHYLEALLLGQAGLLEGNFRDGYPRKLQHEFHYLRTKYRLLAIPIHLHFLRMRPANFPTIRLAQLARLLTTCTSWFSQAKEAGDPKLLKTMLDVTAGPYWEEHFLPDHPSSPQVRRLGEQMKDSLLINTFIPLLYAYGIRRDAPIYLDRAIRWLKTLPPEKNVIIEKWAGLDVRSRHAGDTQALLELKKQYCETRNCLRCAIGKALLTSGG